MADSEPTVIGIYGISGSGKSFLLDSLRTRLDGHDYLFFDGSEVISNLIEGGLEAFQVLEESRKKMLRGLAIQEVAKKAAGDKKTAIVAGHYMLRDGTQSESTVVCTEEDMKNYTHIIYLNNPVEVIFGYRQAQIEKSRPHISIDDLEIWKKEEIEQLRQACYKNNILLSVLDEDRINADYVGQLLSRLQSFTTNKNLERVESHLNGVMEKELALVFDADKTLAPDDSGLLFWQNSNVLKEVFASRLGYSPEAFLQMAMLYEDRTNIEQFRAMCTKVSLSITLYPKIAKIMEAATKDPNVCIIVLTCGLGLVWEMVLTRYGFKNVHVIGNGRLDDVVVDPHVKAHVVDRLRVPVIAFGDSPLDLKMLSRADQAYVVVGSGQARSKSMDVELGYAIRDGLVSPRQILVDADTAPRLDIKMLPVVDVDESFIKSILAFRKTPTVQFIDATNEPATQVLMTSMRDATVAGPALRAIHQRIGWYLATRYLPSVIGVEEFRIRHVQGHDVTGHCVKDESHVNIIAMMRGGEPMAFGVNEALPLASFRHAKTTGDLSVALIQDASAVILVDSVVNSGKSVVEFLEWICAIRKDVPIVVIAGVVQAESVSLIQREQERLGGLKICLVALRKSDNKYTGRGGTDTGNRLFNTTMID